MKHIIPILMVTSAPALAIDSAFVGVWAPVSKGCKAKDSAAFRITPKGIDGREWGCTIKKAAADRDGWLLHLSCAGEGNDYPLTLRWHLAPDGHLHETGRDQSRDYVRCKESGFRPA